MGTAEHWPEWFSGADMSQFLARVRALASQRLGELIAPGATSANHDDGSLLRVDVPGFPDIAGPPIDNILQIRWDGDELRGSWGNRYRRDDGDPRDREALVVRGLRLDDAGAAEAAVSWLATQLSRPVEQQLWTRRAEVVGRRWVLADTGRVLGRRGGPLARLGSPNEVTMLRAGAAGVYRGRT